MATRSLGVEIRRNSVVRLINDFREIDSYYTLANRVIQKNYSPETICKASAFLVKQEGWIAVCDDEVWRETESPMLKTIQNYNYTKRQSVSLDLFEPIVMEVPATEQGIAEFFHQSIGWTLLFAGAPDWMMLFPHPDSFWLVAGKPDFVEHVLGYSAEQAFTNMEMGISHYPFVEQREYKYFSYLLHQLRDVYPMAKIGESVGFSLS